MHLSHGWNLPLTGVTSKATLGHCVREIDKVAKEILTLTFRSLQLSQALVELLASVFLKLSVPNMPLKRAPAGYKSREESRYARGNV